MSNVFQKGFTLVELLVSLAVLGILSATLFAGYAAFSRKADIKTAAFRIVDVLNLAKTRTVASLGGSSYGMHFEQGQYALFKGAVYNALDPDTIAYAVPAGVEIVEIAFAGGGSDVVFDRITGKTAQTGTLKVRSTNDVSVFKVITVIGSGRSDIIEGALTPAGTRIADSRHVHIIYGQGVSSSVTLALNFPGYLTQNVDFQTYYSGGVFDWSGTIAVGGSNQVLRIHTHATSPTSADFSVTRDLRYNNKELQISLDGQNILNYATDGTVSAGTSLYVSGLAAQ